MAAPSSPSLPALAIVIESFAAEGEGELPLTVGGSVIVHVRFKHFPPHWQPLYSPCFSLNRI